jgi:MIP family channel proteins
MANMVCALGHISGAHFNPAITIGFWVTKRMGTLETGLYWISQLAGAVAASFLLKVVVPEDVWRAVNLGTPAPATGFTVASGMILEAVLTFFLVWVVFATAVDERSSFRGVAGYAIGLTVCMGVLAGGPFTGAALNPARAFGPALATGYMTNHGMYWVGPLFGGAVAAALYNSLLMKPKAGGN